MVTSALLNLRLKRWRFNDKKPFSHLDMRMFEGFENQHGHDAAIFDNLSRYQKK